MIKPKVSVLIPSYNYGRYISEAIESVLKQTFQDFEIIIVDNCSDDDTFKIVNEYKKQDSRIKLIVNETNVGMYRNYNEALLHANGEYIKFLNADDKFHQDLLKEFIHVLDNNNDISLVTSHRQYFGNRSDILKSDFIGLQSGKNIIMESLEKGNFIGEPTTVMFRRENLNLGLFDTSLLMFADYDMWLRQLSIGNIFFVDRVLSYFRIHEDQGTQVLNEDINKEVFNNLQLDEYIRYSLIVNRFGYDFTLDIPDRVQSFLKKRYMKNHKFLFVNTKYKVKINLMINSINIFSYLRYFFRRSKFRESL